MVKQISKALPATNLKLFIALGLLLAGSLLVTMQASAQSIEDVENPQSGSIGFEGVVPGEPPQTGATINSPVNGQVFTSIPITVSGTCEAGLIVEIYKNEVFSGSGICTDNNTFSVEIDLFAGENVLLARVRDFLGQRGPDSNSVTVTYDPPITLSERQLGQQMLLTATQSFRGASPGTEMRFTVRLSGGVGPYAININWGDGKNDLISRSDTGEFDITHAYDRPGIYRIVVQASDSNDQAAFLQLTAVVNGEIEGGVEDERVATRTEERYIVWPLIVLAIMIPLAYWLGMRHQRRKYE